MEVGRTLAERAGRDYPLAARRAGLGGTVFLRIVIDARGSIRNVDVHRSSGHETLDTAALALVRGVGNVPPPPAALAWRARPLTVPIAYRRD
jgi:protein TonB